MDDSGWAGSLGGGQDAVCGQAGCCIRSGLFLCTHERTHLLTEDLALHTNFQKGLKTVPWHTRYFWPCPGIWGCGSSPGGRSASTFKRAILVTMAENLGIGQLGLPAATACIPDSMHQFSLFLSLSTPRQLRSQCSLGPKWLEPVGERHWCCKHPI